MSKESSFAIRRVPWWRHPDGGFSARALATIGAVSGLITSLIAALAIVIGQSASVVVGRDQIVQYGDQIVNYGVVEAPGPAAPIEPGAESCSDQEGARLTGWGPDRPTYTVEHGSPYTSLNVVRDNPVWGDERGLVKIRDTSNIDGGWRNEIKVERDRTYQVRMYVHNDAPSSGDSTLASFGTRLSVNLPVCTGRTVAISGFVNSENAYPREIYGGVTLESLEPFNLAYVEGSARLYTNGREGGFPVGEEFLTLEGVPVGYEELDGVLLPGYRYSVIMLFEVRPQFAPLN